MLIETLANRLAVVNVRDRGGGTDTFQNTFLGGTYMVVDTLVKASKDRRLGKWKVDNLGDTRHREGRGAGRCIG